MNTTLKSVSIDLVKNPHIQTDLSMSNLDNSRMLTQDLLRLSENY